MLTLKIARWSALLCAVVLVLASSTATGSADPSPYRTPPRVIEDVLTAPTLPAYLVSPTHDAFAIVTPLRYPPVADLAKPMLRIAGLRIDPSTNGIHHAPSYTSLTIERIADGTTQTVALPQDARITMLRFSPDGKRYAFTNATSHGTDLYVAKTFDPTPVRVGSIEVNAIFGDPVVWMPDGMHLLARTAVHDAPPPADTSVPTGTIVQEASGKAGQIVTYEDLLASPHDEDLFDYYGTSQLAIVDVETQAAQPIGPRGIITAASPSPDGRYLYVEQLHKPYTYLFPFERFPTKAVVLDRSGATVATIFDRPLEDRIPADGVEAGPRDVAWALGAPSTLSWAEALDRGDPRVDVPQRDRLVLKAIGTTTAPVTLMSTKGRIARIAWLANDSRALVSEYDRLTRFTQTWIADTRAPGAPRALGKPLRDGDGYHNPGTPVTTLAMNDATAVDHNGDSIYLRGQGFGPDGERPFLDRLNLADGTSTRVYQSAFAPLDDGLAVNDADAHSLLGLRQSPTMPPNVILQTTGGETALTHVTDPAPIVRQIQRRVVNYTRPDGVKLSFTLYLPPGYKGGRLPTLLWAYPLEFNDADVASQNTNSAQNFVTIGGASELFMALDGYAVLDNATIPIVGSNPLTVNDTYIDQLVAGAKAAIDKAVEIGVTDPNRVAVAGHSYGAFMTANLLAHTHLFRAGIARSGAYNRTLTPFGFQNERRSYWDAPDLYTRMSPFTYADKITDPLLLIHGVADDNTGTFPIQSQRMFAAIQGNGGTVRLVMLPNEAHGYLGRESIATVLAEMDAWLNRFVKNAPPRVSQSASTHQATSP